jgi:FAD dependent oxidoreductase
VYRERQTDILVVGGGLGGIGGALGALRLGKRVIMTEESDWIGGQMTAQAVPPDEHPWIEGTGCTATYQKLRRGIRDFYRRNYPLLPEPRFNIHLNPGNGWVSPLCPEPKAALSAMYDLLTPYLSSGQLEIVLRTRPVSAHTNGARVLAVRVKEEYTGDDVVIQAPYFLDATDLGDLLALAGVEHVIGSESQAQTGEPHAIPGDPDPLDQQAFTHCFAMDYFPGEDHTIARPKDYDFWRNYTPQFWPGPLLSWVFVDPGTLEVLKGTLFEDTTGTTMRDLWTFRRILYRGHFSDHRFPSDISLVNWPQNDYFFGPLLGVSEEEARQHRRGAAQLSLSLLYWMQTEAPRHDGGQGYRGLRLRHDVVGTQHGLAKGVYVRESRRIRAEFTVLEQHIGAEARPGIEGAEVFPDTVGTGSYRIDLHPSTRGRNYVDISSWPFQIPLGALIPVRMENLLPAEKNIGSTHITNGCYRLHPVVWNIGEVAGALAAYCLNHGTTPRAVRNTPKRLADFQRLLEKDLGVVLAWPNPRATAR